MSRLPPRQLAVLRAIRRAEISGGFLTPGILCVMAKTNHHRLKRLVARGLIRKKGRDAPVYTTEKGRIQLTLEIIEEERNS